ncbi:MAG: hypothetical protein CMK82_06955 [Pseudomonadales bacterium]|jgi:hypothetical protein|nr:hypothetical protein [Pseudomonadales bacterium]MCK5529936.1 hypothetical protein [Halopseudomonas aestusnigri]|tara:strand:+ start:139 stop:840 length:702 start_codon:yes stop_codon:yes gene_type:complete
MAIIGSTDFYIGVRSLPKRQFEDYSAHLFDEWEAYVGRELQLPDYSLSLVVEEGSIKAVGRIAAALGVIYIGIGQYGSFIAGLQIIHSQVRTVSGYLGERAGAPFQSSRAKPKVRRSGESLSRLQTLFVKVQRGELSVDEAMAESDRIFGSELDDSIDFKRELQISLEQVPLFPKQLALPLADAYGEEVYLNQVTRKPRPPQPKPPAPDPDLYRVEIRRESRRGEKDVRIISL